MRPRVLIFDFDGVIIESNAFKTEAFDHVFARFPDHHATMMSYHNAHVSLGRMEKFKHLLTLLGRAGDSVMLADLSVAFSTRMLTVLEAAPLVPGAGELLAAASRHLPLYLASVTPADELEQILAMLDLRRWFTGVYGCPPWNKVDAIRDILARELAPAGSAILVGDSAGDQLAARTAGIGFLARDSGLPFDPAIPATFPDMHGILAYLTAEHSWII